MPALARALALTPRDPLDPRIVFWAPMNEPGCSGNGSLQNTRAVMMNDAPGGAVGSKPRRRRRPTKKQTRRSGKIRCAAFVLCKPFSKFGQLISQTKSPP
ncbi:hypothetical protein HDG40_000179 [Paraburkholderia sp. JPY158]|uniref:Uncharacterized protein n=1 Tax=Paraburkholderia atlantica TaxID=2654982 RepID=A0A7W8Q1J8_PARAM|nr:hypothetical protein [Paraburkholderia atlantica]MBB5422038.1 hypothetical protein [Paraburkholderia atlantica]